MNTGADWRRRETLYILILNVTLKREYNLLV